MKRILTAFAVAALGLAVAGPAEAAKPPGGHAGARKSSGDHRHEGRGDHYRDHRDHYYGHYHGHYGYGHRYGHGHGFYGARFKSGWYFPGRYHYHWSKRWFCPSYKCWFFYCPRTCVWYYWYAPGVCYYPVSYITCAAPVVRSSPGVVDLDRLPVVP